MLSTRSDNLQHNQFGEEGYTPGGGTMAEHGIYQGLTVFGTHHPADRALFYKRFAHELHGHASGAPASTSDQLHFARAVTDVPGGLGEEE